MHVFLTAQILVLAQGSARVGAQANEVSEGARAVAAGRALYEAGELELSLDALEAALARTDLARDDAVRALETALLIQWIRHDSEAVLASLRTLAGLIQREDAPPDFPPRLAAEFARVRAAATEAVVRGRVEVAPREVRVRAEVERDSMGLVRELIVHARHGAGPFESGLGELRVVRERWASVHYFIEARGPGGVLVAHQGSREAPVTFALEAGGPATSHDEDGSEPSPWIWIALGGGAAIAAAIVLVLVATAGEPTFQPGVPRSLE